MFGKFMNKKFFHPSSYPNQKQRWIHEQRAAAKEKNEEEKKATYQKEQESYQSRLLSAKSANDKMKLDLNFMYDLPPGMKRDNDQEEEKEEEVKFEWQKHAPRSRYVKDLGLECQDQPFGICVKNIRCFKCRAWGHQNTDRECPLFFSNVNSEANTNDSQAESLWLSDPLRLVAEMKKQHGITLKKSVIGQEIDPMASNQQLIDSDAESEDLGETDLAYIESLTAKQKKKLLKSLNKMEKSEKKKHKRKKKERERIREPEEELTSHRRNLHEHRRKSKRKQDDLSETDQSDDEVKKTISECRKQSSTVIETKNRKRHLNRYSSSPEKYNKERTHRKRKRR